MSYFNTGILPSRRISQTIKVVCLNRYLIGSATMGKQNLLVINNSTNIK